MQNIEEIINQARELHQNLNYQEAEKLYLQGLEIFPENHQLFFMLGVLYGQINNNENEINYLKKAVNLEPENPIYHLNLGEALLKKNERPKNLNGLKNFLKVNPNSYDGHFKLAELLKASGNYQEAIEHYKQVILLNANHLNAYNNLGDTYAEHLLYKEAAETFGKLIKISPDFPGIKEKLVHNLQMIIAIKTLTDNFQAVDKFSDINEKFDEDEVISSYLTLLKKCVTDSLRIKSDTSEFARTMEGLCWPIHAETMIGIKRLNNLHYCLNEVKKNNIEGDFIETGVWRGGSVIFMRGFLKAHGITDKVVWAADSFEGLPKPDPKYPQDEDNNFYTMQPLSVSQYQVKENFKQYGLLDDQVKFIKGWFKDTLPSAPIEKLSVLRLDADMYQSTIEALINLYPKLSVGGYIIVDDYGAIDACRKAVSDYRKQNNINDQILNIDHSGIYWQKTV